MSAPRLVTRALVLSFLTVALMLGAVFTVLSVGVRDLVYESRIRVEARKALAREGALHRLDDVVAAALRRAR